MCGFMNFVVVVNCWWVGGLLVDGVLYVLFSVDFCLVLVFSGQLVTIGLLLGVFGWCLFFSDLLFGFLFFI